jgi:hypothetical protein
MICHHEMYVHRSFISNILVVGDLYVVILFCVLYVKFVQTIGLVIHRATLRHSVTAVIHLFPVLRQLRAVKPEFEKVLEVCLPACNQFLCLFDLLLF